MLECNDPHDLQRQGLAVCVLGGYLYTLVGNDECSFLKTVERYEPNATKWSHAASMATARSLCDVAVIAEVCLFHL